jgi:hypothetical protein
VLTVVKTVFELGGLVTEGIAKTKAGERLIFLDAETARMLREHHTAQVKARMLAGKAWQDDDLISSGRTAARVLPTMCPAGSSARAGSGRRAA